MKSSPTEAEQQAFAAGHEAGRAEGREAGMREAAGICKACAEGWNVSAQIAHRRILSSVNATPKEGMVLVPRESLMRWANEEYTATASRWTKFRNDIRAILSAVAKSQGEAPDATVISEGMDHRALIERHTDCPVGTKLYALPPTSNAEELAKVVLDNLSYLENLIDLRGHESGLLKNHPRPCVGHDFCLMRQAQKGADAIRAYTQSLREKK